MQTVAINFDKDITLAEAQRAAAAIGCTLQVDIVRMPNIPRVPAQAAPPSTDIGVEELDAAAFDLPNFLRRQAD